MMFLDDGRPSGDVLAISQPAHAWVSGQLLRQWATPLPPPLLLAAEQHDLAWLDWETAPVFDPATGRPTLFRDVGAAAHAPLWTQAVDRAEAAWGRHVALLISRHGSVIYNRFTDRHRTGGDDDTAAANHYLQEQGVRQRAWAATLGLRPAQLEAETDLIAFADTLSLALCGALATPLDILGPHGARYQLHGPRAALTLAPWPFAAPSVSVAAPARTVPHGRFPDASAMRAWLAAAPWTWFEASLHPG